MNIHYIDENLMIIQVILYTFVTKLDVTDCIRWTAETFPAYFGHG